MPVCGVFSVFLLCVCVGWCGGGVVNLQSSFERVLTAAGGITKKILRELILFAQAFLCSFGKLVLFYMLSAITLC